MAHIPNSTKRQYQITIEDRERCTAWLQVGNMHRNVVQTIGVKQTVFKVIHVQTDPEALQTEGTSTSTAWHYASAQTSHKSIT